MSKEEIELIKQIITMILYQSEFPHEAKLALIEYAKKAGIDFEE